MRALSAIYASRLLGLYMVLPVLSPYAARLEGATSILIGLSLGAYGATQAIFQIPFGYMSDRLGRKRAITFGLILFAGGSVLAALAKNAWVLVIARGLQGSGAITSAVVAWIADLTREEVRTQAMARVGMWIGGTFAASVLVGPTLAGIFGVPLLFLLTAVGGGVSIVYMNLKIPDVRARHPAERLHTRDLLRVLRQPPLLMIDIGIFLLHVTVTVLFVVLPFDLERVLGPGRTWMVLVPALAVGLAIMSGIGRRADRRDRIGPLFFVGASVLGVSCLFFALVERSAPAAFAGILLFVASIAILEPILASLLSRFAHGPHRGTASGVYSMAQFSGAFVGGLVGGAFLRRGQDGMFLALSVCVAVWIVGLARVGHISPSLGRGSTGSAAIDSSAAPQGGDQTVGEVREPDTQGR